MTVTDFDQNFSSALECLKQRLRNKKTKKSAPCTGNCNKSRSNIEDGTGDGGTCDGETGVNIPEYKESCTPIGL